MADNVDYESLSQEERLKRIGALFCKAATLILSRQSMMPDARPVASDVSVVPTKPQGTLDVATLRAEELALLKRFSSLGEFSPREATQFWRTSRTSAYRRLRSLEEAGWIVKNGNTSAVRYRIAAQV